MKFKNETGANAKYRLGSIKSGFNWYTVRPGETKDIPEHIGDDLKLTKIEEEKDYVEAKPTIEDPKDVDATFQEDTTAEDLESYRKELIAVKGVGKKSAQQIIDEYPTKKDLLKAVQDGEEIHKHDGIDAAVKKSF